MLYNVAMRGAAILLLMASFSGPEEQESRKPRLVLDAPRVQMLLPGLAAKGYGKRVEVTARLEGEPENPKELYCLDEVWEWGDGTESLHENDCDPYEQGMELQRDFRRNHHYRPGQYTISLRLTRGDDTVIRGFVDVRVY